MPYDLSAWITSSKEQGINAEQSAIQVNEMRYESKLGWVLTECLLEASVVDSEK